MILRDYQDALDKAPTQYLSLHSGKMEDAPWLFQFQSPNVQIFGYVFHDTSGQNLGHVSKNQWFLLNETCMDTH